MDDLRNCKTKSCKFLKMNTSLIAVTQYQECFCLPADQGLCTVSHVESLLCLEKECSRQETDRSQEIPE